MQQVEFDRVMLPSDLPHECKLIYIYLRRWVDFDSGCVGYKRRVSYQGIREFLEYLPHQNSNEAEKVYSRDQVKRYISRLITEGVIEPLHDRASPRKNMFFRLTLMETESVRVGGARHERAMGSAPQENPVTTGLSGGERAMSAPQGARHASVVKKKCINEYKYAHKHGRAGEVISAQWRPPDDLVDRLVDSHGLDVGVVGQKVLEFRIYWRDRGEARADWDWLFAEYVANSPEAAKSSRNASDK